MRKEKVRIREEGGLRIGTLICDQEGFCFSPTPLLIASGKAGGSTGVNAVVLSRDQVRKVTSAVLPGMHEKESKVEDIQQSEVGAKYADDEKIKEIKVNIDQNPPRQFDVERKARVFNTQFEFVELCLKGCNVEKHTIKIPPKLLLDQLGKSDAEKQLKATWSLFNKQSKISSKGIRDKKDELLKRYTKQLPKYGRVLLKAKKKEFEEELNSIKDDVKELQKDLEAKLGDEIKKAKERLIDLLFSSLVKNSPDDLRMQIPSGKPTEEQTRKWLEKELDEVFPSPEKVIKKMSLEYIYKGITYETAKDEIFQKNVKKAYSFIEWDDLFKEYDAAQEANLAS